MILKKNDDIVIDIDSVTSEGSGIGRYDNLAVFVRGAVPGDKITAHIIKTSKNYAVGIVKNIISPSKNRIVSDCPVSDKCGGCSFRNMKYEEELRLKSDMARNNLLRIGHIDFPPEEIIGAENTDNYRNKAQYPVCCGNGKFSAGFYAYKSHRIIDCGFCRLQPAEFKNGISAFKNWALKNNVSSFDEITGKGLLRHIYFRKAFATGEVMACAVINGNDIPDKQLLINLLNQAFNNLKSVVININKNRTNVILGSKTKVIWGSDKITDVLLGKKFVISAESFYQVNHAQCEKLYETAAEFAALSGNEVLLDMYCGAGTIGLTMADKCKQIVGVEIIPSAVENAKENALINGIDNAQFICADALEGAKILTEGGIMPDIVILDPPRKGCCKEIFDVIEKLNINKIIYISCNSATLARDLEILKNKNYILKRFKIFDLFPRTPHFESIAEVVRKNIKKIG
ncbi:MAG: 23S rRNA (uracil(1939)-C(5))-methyltransferase RlmD [Clostridiales bacterium]|nr:23S rRNA (uracil(1939)-C(5))-methyltransferase RlmD [Clostridiales bacterium]